MARRRGLSVPDLILAACLLAGLAAAALLLQRPDRTGVVRVVDGDTVAFGSRRVRLRGMDAPELDQTCVRSGTAVPCGREASAALRDLVGSSAIRCRIDGADRWGRDLGRCFVGDLDLGAAMVERGQAVSWSDYRAEEARARDGRRGLWGGAFEAPAEWRRKRDLAH